MTHVALNAAAEMVGLREVSATVNAVEAQQLAGDWVPFVRAWSAQLLADDRLLAVACALAGVDTQVEAALQWRDTVLGFAAQLRPALVATRNTFALPAFAAIGGAAFDAVLVALDRGELRSRRAVAEQLGDDDLLV